MPTPEELARVNIDEQLTACGWDMQDMSALNRYASLGVAVREFPVDGGPHLHLRQVQVSTAGKGSGRTIIRRRVCPCKVSFPL